jgi:hypothetical protein
MATADTCQPISSCSLEPCLEASYRFVDVQTIQSKQHSSKDTDQAETLEMKSRVRAIGRGKDWKIRATMHDPQIRGGAAHASGDGTINLESSSAPTAPRLKTTIHKRLMPRQLLSAIFQLLYSTSEGEKKNTI